MKTHTIKTPTAELLIVEMPEGAKIRYYTLKDNDFDGIGILQHHQKTYIITGSYTLLGKLNEIKEEDAAKLFCNPIDSTNLTHYANLRNLFSLIESEIYWENPYPYPSPYDPRSKTGRFEQGKELEEAEKNYNEAEQKTFNKNRTLIFFKN